MRRILGFGFLLAVLVVSAVAAADKTIPMPADHAYAALKPGPGVEVTRQQCVSCHSQHGEEKELRASLRRMER